ncbi:MAG TPA: GNAT family protein [Rubrobacteraceae bacterium]|nr:GNAT family protein [Rubrobacteraceae bacterium]
MRLSGRSRKLVGERVELRRHESMDYELYGRWYGDPEIWRLTSWAGEPLTGSAVRRLFEDRELSTTEDSFAIHPKEGRGPVGIVSLMNISEANGTADLSIIIGPPEARGRGYGTDAIRAILRYGFEERGLGRVGLSVFDFNEAAIRAYTALGFREEGRLRAALEREGKRHDAILMSILASEWREGSG